MIKLVTIIGARPQIIKAAALSRAIKSHFPSQIVEIIVHTGQHYDESMSQVFFDELEIPKPNYNLNVGSHSHGEQTAKMIQGIEKILLDEVPDYLVVYGDTNSTLAGAIAASKIHVPIVHIEAGLRSFNKKMPEEINRILTDHCSTYLFSPTATGINNLINEGFLENTLHPTMDSPKIANLGDVMLDNSLFFAKKAEKQTELLDKLQIQKGEFVLCTIHRNDNTDNASRLGEIFDQLLRLAKENKLKLVFPLHPRTRAKIEQLDNSLVQRIHESPYMLLIEPVSFLDMILLEKHAKLVVTDSGGVQKEAYFFNIPCVIVRNQTEWVEIIEAGMAVLSQPSEIFDKSKSFLSSEFALSDNNLFGDGQAAKKILAMLISNKH